MLSVTDVSVELGGRTVLADVSFEVHPGERVVVLGVNGCGKTVLLKLLNGLIDPTRGQIRYAGLRVDSRALGDATLRRRFRSEVALLFQNVDAMLFNPTVADEIAFAPRQLLLPDVEARISQWAQRFGAAALLDRAPFELSGGEKKRVALATVFALDPQLLLLDEPTANMDPAACAHLIDLLSQLAGLTVISSTHNLSLAEELGSRCLVLAPQHRGLLFDGPTSALLGNRDLLIESGLAHRHGHRHPGIEHAHFHVHDYD